MSHPSYLLAAFKQRIADSLHDYADQAEHGRTVDPLDADVDLLRGVRFAAELVAGRIHNPHAANCACPCDKPDPALLPVPPARWEDVADLADVVAEAGLDDEAAAAVAKAVLAAGYRTVPASLPPGPPHQRRTPEGQEPVHLPAYLHEADDGGFVLRVPCRGCDMWHAAPTARVMAGDRVKVSMPCAEPAEGLTVVVQAARFNRTWQRGGKLARAYLILGAADRGRAEHP